MQPDKSDTPRKDVLPETTIIVVICGLDLLSTVYLIATRTAREANPLFSNVLHSYGPVGFIFLKTLFIAVPLVTAELARGKHPQFVKNMLRLCIAAYILLYAYSFVRNNTGPPPADLGLIF